MQVIRRIREPYRALKLWKPDVHRGRALLARFRVRS